MLIIIKPPLFNGAAAIWFSVIKLFTVRKVCFIEMKFGIALDSEQPLNYQFKIMAVN